MVHAAPTTGPETLWSMFPTLCTMLGFQGENVFRCITEIFESYLLLDQRPAVLEVYDRHAPRGHPVHLKELTAAVGRAGRRARTGTRTDDRCRL